MKICERERGSREATIARLGSLLAASGGTRLLSALWDAAFDAGLASFGYDGMPLLAPGLSAATVAALVRDAPAGTSAGRPALAGLLPAHHMNLRDHWLRHGFADRGGVMPPLEGTHGPVDETFVNATGADPE